MSEAPTVMPSGGMVSKHMVPAAPFALVRALQAPPLTRAAAYRLRPTPPALRPSRRTASASADAPANPAGTPEGAVRSTGAVRRTLSCDAAEPGGTGSTLAAEAEPWVVAMAAAMAAPSATLATMRRVAWRAVSLFVPAVVIMAGWCGSRHRG